MTTPAVPNTPPAGAPAAPAQGAPEAPPARQTTTDVIAAARQRLAEGGSILDAESDAATPPAGEAAAPAPAAGADVGPTALTVTLPGMEERGEKPLELEAPDRETYERLNRLNNEAGIGRQVKAERGEIQRSRTELTEVEDKIAVDPTGFILQHLPEDVRVQIAMHMLFEPGILEGVQERLTQGEDGRSLVDLLEDPDQLRTLRAELKASRLEMRDRLRQSTEQRRTMQANADRVIAEIERLIPESVTGEQRELLFRDAVRDVRERVQRLGLREIDPQDVKTLVTARLRGHQALRGAGTGGPVRSGPAAASARRAAPAAMPAELPAGTAERIKLARKVGLEALLDRARATTT